MIHQYKLGGLNIVIDVNSGAVHVVDEVAYDIIAMYKDNSAEEIVKYIQKEDKDYTIRIHAGENDSLKNNVYNSIECVKKSIKKGEKIGATRVIPLIIDEERIITAEKLIKEKNKIYLGCEIYGRKREEDPVQSVGRKR